MILYLSTFPVFVDQVSGGASLPLMAKQLVSLNPWSFSCFFFWALCQLVAFP